MKVRQEIQNKVQNIFLFWACSDLYRVKNQR